MLACQKTEMTIARGYKEEKSKYTKERIGILEFILLNIFQLIHDEYVIKV
jgi:hypothetical protein